MKSRQRPPLNLTDPEPEIDAMAEIKAALEAPDEPAADLEPTSERPLSERRRRRLA